VSNFAKLKLRIVKSHQHLSNIDPSYWHDKVGHSAVFIWFTAVFAYCGFSGMSNFSQLRISSGLNRKVIVVFVHCGSLAFLSLARYVYCGKEHCEIENWFVDLKRKVHKQFTAASLNRNQNLNIPFRSRSESTKWKLFSWKVRIGSCYERWFGGLYHLLVVLNMFVTINPYLYILKNFLPNQTKIINYAEFVRRSWMRFRKM